VHYTVNIHTWAPAIGRNSGTLVLRLGTGSWTLAAAGTAGTTGTAGTACRGRDKSL
jgi:hypothetical protein